VFCTVNYPDRACGRETVVVDHFEWGGKHIEVHQCPRGHVTEWEAHPDEQG
jgi:hypothetical protein